MKIGAYQEFKIMRINNDLSCFETCLIHHFYLQEKNAGKAGTGFKNINPVIYFENSTYEKSSASFSPNPE